MSDRSGTTVALDLAGLESLANLPASADAVAVLFQDSPARRESLARAFPGARLATATPRLDGPWQADVDADLRELERRDVAFEGVPLLDVFRAPWRDELEFLRALQRCVRDADEVVAAEGGRAAAMMSVVSSRPIAPRLRVVESVPSARRSGWLARLRRVGARGAALALWSRLDPSGARRARIRRRPRLDPAHTLMVSSYVNATRAALEAHEALGGGSAVLVCAGPGALGGLQPPPGVRVVPLVSALALQRERAARACENVVPRVLERLGADADPDDAWATWPIVRSTRFGAALERVLLPEVVSGIVALRAVMDATGARRLIVGDEFSSVDRAAIHLARSIGLESVSRQHGVLDSHYLRDRLLADRHLAWDAATASWLEERGAVASRRVDVVPRTTPPAPASKERPGSIVAFLQPFEFLDVSIADWMHETVPALARVASAAGLRVLLKPHPLQTRTAVEDHVPVACRGVVDVVVGRSARDLLADAVAGVTLDSSVAVDCRDAGVPCLSTAWYAGTYVEHLVRLGVLEACRTPDALETSLRAHVERRTRT